MTAADEALGFEQTQDSSQSASKPKALEQSPKNRSWPSLSCKILSKVCRQRPGAAMGSSPSITSTKASACQSVLLSKG